MNICRSDYLALFQLKKIFKKIAVFNKNTYIIKY
jgi:hypothetical protein